MNSLLLLLLVAVVAVYLQRRNAPRIATPALYILMGLAILLSGARLFQPREHPLSHAEAQSIFERFERAAYHRLGQAIAEDIPAGSTLLIIHEGEINEAARRKLVDRLPALEQGLGAAYTLHLAGPTGDEPIDGFFLTEPVLRGFLEDYPDAHAVVSLIGAPYGLESPAPDAFPPIYCLSGRDEDHLIALLNHHIVRAAVLYRSSGIDWNARLPDDLTPEEVFDLRFVLVRPGEELRLRERGGPDRGLDPGSPLRGHSPRF